MSAGGPFIGPVAAPELPEQPKWPAAWCPRWEAFDVPRLWDMVEPEGNAAVHDQVLGFRHLSQVLEQFYRLLRTRHSQIAEAWQSPASAEFLRVLDEFGTDVLSTSACALQTAYALDSTVKALETARDQIRELKTQWDDATTDWIPEWWNHEARDLNQRARQVMAEADKAVEAARRRITSPDRVRDLRFPPPETESEQTAGATDEMSPTAGTPDANRRKRVPPVPGYDPIEDPGSPELAEIPGAPQAVPAVPGSPVSMLPIPPGSPYAPSGGAYILPGPGVGRGGYVVPIPPSSGPLGGPRTLMPPNASGSGQSASGMMPVPMAGGAAAAAGGHAALYRRANVKWQVEEGVPPVIKVDHDELVPGQPTIKQEEEFKDWFSELAYPWRAEFKSGDGAHVTVRSVSQ